LRHPRRHRFWRRIALAVDNSYVYVGKVSWTDWPKIFPDTPRPAQIRCVQKFEKSAKGSASFREAQFGTTDRERRTKFWSAASCRR